MLVNTEGISIFTKSSTEIQSCSNLEAL